MGDNDTSFRQKMIINEIAGKKAAIHAYDKIVWTVRSGFLTLVFAGWALVIKAAIESDAEINEVAPYFFMLCAFSIVLAVGGYLIDRNYVRRKFRVIRAVNDMMHAMTQADFDDKQVDFGDLLGISGDADNKKYRIGAYRIEMVVTSTIYSVPGVLIAALLVYYIIKI